MPKTVIGLVGPIASGKGTVAQILKKKGFKFYSLSEVLKDEIRRRGLEVSRYNCNRISNELRGTIGADVLARRTAEVIDQDNPANVVIDAIRNPAEIEFLKQKFNAYIVGVVADQKKRFELFVSRGIYMDEIKTWEDFRELDDREMAQAGAHKQQIKACLDVADYIIENKGTIRELREKLEISLADLPSSPSIKSS